MHWTEKSKICSCCGKIRHEKMFIDSEYCVKCKYEQLLSTHLKKCARCLNWLDKFEGKTCQKCLDLCKVRNKEYRLRTGIKDKDKLTKCTLCNEEKGPRFFRKKLDTCVLCTNKKKNSEQGKLKCKWCKGWRYIQEKGLCEKCIEKGKRDSEKKREYYAENREEIIKSRKQYRKNNRDKFIQYNINYRKKNPDKAKIDCKRYYELNKEYKLEYNRHYYYNVIKPIYNKVFALQWQAGLLRERKVNRDGYWYQLNRTLFQGFRNRPHMWFSLQNKIIKFMQTGKGKIQGDTVILDSAKDRKKFLDYLDSDEGMSAKEKPKYSPRRVPFNEYFK